MCHQCHILEKISLEPSGSFQPGLVALQDCYMAVIWEPLSLNMPRIFPQSYLCWGLFLTPCLFLFSFILNLPSFWYLKSFSWCYKESYAWETSFCTLKFLKVCILLPYLIGWLDRLPGWKLVSPHALKVFLHCLLVSMRFSENVPSSALWSLYFPLFWF